jgi:hypothetical protein
VGTAWIGAIVLGVVVALTLFQIGRGPTRLLSGAGPALNQRMDSEWRRKCSRAVMAVLPVAMVFVASLIGGRSIFVPRYLIVAAPAWWLLLADGATVLAGFVASVGIVARAATGRRPVPVIGAFHWTFTCLAAFTLASGALREARGGEKIAWDRLAAAIAADAGPGGGTVYTLEGFTALPMAWYARAGDTRLRVKSLTPGQAIEYPAWVVLHANASDLPDEAPPPVMFGARVTVVATEMTLSQTVRALRLSAP